MREHILEINMVERQHSLQWHHDNLINIHDRQLAIGKSYYEEKRQYTAICDMYFQNACVFGVELYDEINAKKIKIESKSAFIEEPNLPAIDTVRLPLETFNVQKTYLFKKLYMFDSMVEQISNNNIDVSVLKGGRSITDVREGLIWLYCDCFHAAEMEFQDVNRLKNTLRLQVFKAKQRDRMYFDESIIDDFYKIVMDSLYESSEAGLRGYLKYYKGKTRIFINTIFDVYQELNLYREYLLSTDVCKVIYEDEIGIGKIVTLAETICNNLTQYFTSYSTIKNLSLCRSELTDSHFVHSDLSDSSFNNSTLTSVNMRNSVWKNCDLSLCDLSKSSATDSDFSGSNFNYSNLTGMNLRNSMLNDTMLNYITLRDPNMESFDWGNKIKNSGLKKTERKNAADIFTAWKKNSDIVAEEQRSLRDTQTKLLVRLEDLEGSENAISWTSNSTTEDSEKEIASIKDNLAKLQYRTRKAVLLGHKLRKTAINHMENFKVPTEFSKLTTVNEKKNDHSPKLCSNGVTVIDEIVKLLNNNMQDLVSYHEANVLSPKLLEVLQKSEQRKIARATMEDRISLAVATLHEASIKRAKISGIDLSHIDITDASFDDSDMSEATLYYTKGEKAYLGKTNLNKADVYCSDLTNSSLRNASLIDAMILNTKLKSVTLPDALLINTVIINTQLDAPYLKKVLTEVSPVGDLASYFDLTDNVSDKEIACQNGVGDMRESDWTGVTATNCLLIGLNLDRSHFEHSKFKSGTWINTLARWSTFDYADFTYSLNVGISYHQSSMLNLLVSKSRFYAVEFSGCRLNGSNFIGARFDKTMFYDTDLSQVNFAHAELYNCIFRDAKFEHTNFSNASFINVSFINCDFNQCFGMRSSMIKDCFIHNCSCCKQLDEKMDIDVPDSDEDVSLTPSDNQNEYHKTTYSYNCI